MGGFDDAPYSLLADILAAADPGLPESEQIDAAIRAAAQDPECAVVVATSLLQSVIVVLQKLDPSQDLMAKLRTRSVRMVEKFNNEREQT